MTIYSQIDSNKRKTWLIMALFVVFITTIAYVFGKASGYGLSYAGIALIISGIMSFVSYYFSDSIIMAISGAKQISEKEDRELFHLVQNLSIASGLPMPKVYKINDPSPNAFATGRDPKHAAVAVTQGLEDKLDKTELEGVIAHELSHIKDYDTRLMAVVTILVGLVALLADWFMRSLWWGRGGRDSRNSRSEGIFLVLGIVLAILSPIIATLIQLAISRRREFLADAAGAYITRFPEGLARALEKISSDRRPAGFANNATAHLFIVNPFKGKNLGSWFSGLFDTHPPIEERIRLLRQM
ncbi:zinc metalloprotease HtpX [Candidatus Gottesmanbacteria bacterium RIFCSPHIGHO2_01_FULL_47_48]|uniref:Protease HtpX homolog n=1 Tax=Candidatus Gottesmanbacteria bacterium RIFCSPHIGHO2_01_FULL_47_48 TaxID=1798381 RepID=A0A1F6A5M7_9BACT|nr:MAG: zinc metalloprotease HtpX [Candidatus Gottesmanbacteria bacterium RIFCSPHIGHO2_01_FULL_47_48]